MPRKHSLNTQLPFLEEMQFRDWVKQNRVPVNIDAPETDYDMRGFYQAMQQQDPRAVSAIDPYDKRTHYPDYWKNPTHETFSAESRLAGPGAPRWTADDQLVSPSGRILHDPRKPKLRIGSKVYE